MIETCVGWNRSSWDKGKRLESFQSLLYSTPNNKSGEISRELRFLTSHWISFEIIGSVILDSNTWKNTLCLSRPSLSNDWVRTETVLMIIHFSVTDDSVRSLAINLRTPGHKYSVFHITDRQGTKPKALYRFVPKIKSSDLLVLGQTDPQ